MTKARCPNNKKHKRFTTTALVLEEWVVDKHGEFIEVSELLEIVHKPDPDNPWTCFECGDEAIVEPT